MNKNLLVGLGVFLAVVIAGFVLIQKPKTNMPVASVSPNSPVKEFNVSAKEFSYTPSSITVSKGDTVKINFTNNGTTAHNFTISDLGIASKTINPGETDTVTFAASQTGNFTYFCSIDSHESLGLKGTLTIN